ncbi:putative arginine--tRNA ligase, mitochondrial [Ciona intestinalis]
MLIKMAHSRIVFFSKKHFWTRIPFKLRKFHLHPGNQDSIDHGQTLANIYLLKSRYGFHSPYFDKQLKQKIVIDFSSPNIAKTFHVGHYRSTVIGNFISNILKAAGHEVCRINYLGDWGLQFALIALGFQKYGCHTLLQKYPLTHLFDVYVKISSESKNNPDVLEEANTIFLNMENNDKEAMEFWKLIRKVSLKEYRKLYDKINISFDEYNGESEYRDKAKWIISNLQQASLLTNVNGKICMDLSNSDWLNNTPNHIATLARANGTTVYLSRDVAAAIHRHDVHKFDRSIYITDENQRFHFQQLFAIIDKMGYKWASRSEGRLVHKTFGRISKMQTRKGEVVFFTDILDEAMEKLKTDRQQHGTRKLDIKNENEVLKLLALSGLLCHDFKSKLQKGYAFSWSAVLSSKGFTGLFLQYTHCRLCSLEENCGVPLVSCIDLNVLEQYQDMVNIIKHLSCYSEVVKAAYVSLEPSYVLKYLFQLSHLTAKGLRSCNIKRASSKDAETLLFSFHCVKTNLANGMQLLGITPLEKM